MKTLEPKVQTFPLNRVIFDLDNTLINAENIKAALFQELDTFGISSTQAKTIYENTKKQNAENVFTLDMFVKLTTEAHLSRTQETVSVQKLQKKLKKIAEHSVVPYSQEILTDCVKKKRDIYLLSSGDQDWQMKKILWTGLAKFFKRSHIMIVAGDNVFQKKCHAIHKIFGKFFDGSHTLFVNARPDETKVILESFPHIVCFLRYEERNTRFPRETFNALQQSFPKRVLVDTSLQPIQTLEAEINENLK